MSETSGRRAQGRVGTVINGKWQVDARIGAGGMATVYAVTHRNGGRAALKLLHAQLSRDEAVRTRFLREGYLANSVAHPGVCTVLDDGYTEDGCAYLVMELLEGETVEAKRLRTDGRLPVDEALEVADQALATLAAAHDKGIVHRDVKPENMFLTTSGQVKLLDFGLARLRDATMEATATGVTIGTPEFMPPEQAVGKGDLVDARSDVWGLGASLFAMLSGQYVHDAKTLHEQLIASATKRARPVRDVAPHVPPAVAQVVARALELERSDRWQSAGEMQRALRAARAAPRVVVGGGDTLESAPSDRTVLNGPGSARASGPISSEPATLESAVRRYNAQETMALAPVSAPPYTPSPRTERLSGPAPAPGPGVGQVTMQMRPLSGSSPGVPSHPQMSATSGMSAMSGSGAMPSHPPPHPHALPPNAHNGSGSYPFVQLPASLAPPPPPGPQQGPRSPAVTVGASLGVLLLVFLVSAYIYYRSVGVLP